MYPPHEHAFYLWLIIIGAVCVTTIIGAAIDRYYLNRRLRAVRASHAEVILTEPIAKNRRD